MSLVGPRPNVQREVDLYTELEFGLLSVKPGITDLSSIVFSDEGDILADFDDPDLAYNQYIRPYKSSLGLFYIKNSSFSLDLQILFLTLFASFNRKQALRLLTSLLVSLKAPDSLIHVSARRQPYSRLLRPAHRMLSRQDPRLDFFWTFFEIIFYILSFLFSPRLFLCLRSF